MPVPSSINDLSTTPGSNSPPGTESPSTADDYFRAHAAFIASLRDGKAADADVVKLTGNQTIGGTKTFSSTITGTTSTQVSLTGNQTVAGVKTFSSAPVVAGLNTGQLAGMRNKIINGKMEIAQRGTSFAAIASSAYSLDRWTPGYATSAVTTISQQSDVPSNNEFQSSLRIAVTTADTSIAAGDGYGIEQKIEGYNVRDLIGRTFTLSFWVRSSKTGIHCVSLRNSGNDRSYVAEYTINAANTWEQKSITVNGGLITAGTWNWTNGVGINLRFELACGSTFHTTANAWQTGLFLGTANQVNCLDSNTNIFAITGVQLEVGSVATPFEHRPFGAELALCQRYAIAYSLAEVGQATNNNITSGGTVWFKQSMRGAPTMSVASFNASVGSAGTPATISPTVECAFVYNSAANWTTGANVRLTALFSVEL
jgi:hypothetical protein